MFLCFPRQIGQFPPTQVLGLLDLKGKVWHLLFYNLSPDRTFGYCSYVDSLVDIENEKNIIEREYYHQDSNELYEWTWLQTQICFLMICLDVEPNEKTTNQCYSLFKKQETMWSIYMDINNVRGRVQSQNMIRG